MGMGQKIEKCGYERAGGGSRGVGGPPSCSPSRPHSQPSPLLALPPPVPGLVPPQGGRAMSRQLTGQRSSPFWKNVPYSPRRSTAPSRAPRPFP